MRKVEVELISHRALAQGERERQVRVARALSLATDALYSLQREDGHWCGELEGSTILESEYMMMLCFLGRGDDPRIPRAAEHLRRTRRPGGAWGIHPTGPVDPSTSVKAYFALKLAGDLRDAPHMVEARRAILSHGGLASVNSFTKIFLALFGQVDWSEVPAIPPELILLPRWAPLNIYEMSSWSRVMLIPLSIIWAKKPVHPIPREQGIGELGYGRLVATPRDDLEPLESRQWRERFLRLDRQLRRLEPHWPGRLRALALGRAERWLSERMRAGDGLGAIFPPMVGSTIAFVALGHGADHPLVTRQLEALSRLELGDGETLRVQPCFGPVWDTANAIHALSAASPNDPRLLPAARWLLEREVGELGDWAGRVRGARPGGWAFQYDNPLNPDADDTALVLSALARVELPSEAERDGARRARRRGVDWLLRMQNKDGGFAAFDRGCTRELLTQVPFADHNAMIDPSTEDVTGRVLEAFALHGITREQPPSARAIEFLRRRQERDGTWYGRWGCNYLYGTWLALEGLRCAGEDMGLRRHQRAGDWIRPHQAEDGGFGESPRSYDDPEEKGRGVSTASQTSWALLGLSALGDRSSPTVKRAIDHLLDTQRPDGSWEDAEWTGTGFPSVFYLRYHLYDKYFPLRALANYRRGGAP